MSDTLVRPELTEQEKSKVLNWAKTIIFSKGRQASIAVMIALITENMRLTKEVNQHREARGFDKLPEYEPRF